jgi:hypothetical protein
MNPKVDKVIYIVLGSALVFTIIAYLILGLEWAKQPFHLTLAIVCLYNLLFNKPWSKTKKE